MSLFVPESTEYSEWAPFPEEDAVTQVSTPATTTFAGATFVLEKRTVLSQIAYAITSVASPGTFVLAIYQARGGITGVADLVTTVTRAVSASGAYVDNCAVEVTLDTGIFHILVGKIGGDFSFAAWAAPQIALLNGALAPGSSHLSTYATAITASGSPPATFSNPGQASTTTTSPAPVIRFKRTVIPPSPTTLFGSDLKVDIPLITSGNTVTAGKLMQINNVGTGPAFNFQPQSADPTYAPQLVTGPWGFEGGLFDPRNPAVNPTWTLGSANANHVTQFGSSTPNTWWVLFAPRAEAARLAIAQRDAGLLHGFSANTMFLVNSNGLRFRIDPAVETTDTACPIPVGNLYLARFEQTGSILRCTVNGATSFVSGTYPATQNDLWNLGGQAISAGINFLNAYVFRYWAIGRASTSLENTAMDSYVSYTYAGASTAFGVAPPTAIVSTAPDNGCLHVPVLGDFPSTAAFGDRFARLIDHRLWSYNGTTWIPDGTIVRPNIGVPARAYAGGKVAGPYSKK